MARKKSPSKKTPKKADSVLKGKTHSAKSPLISLKDELPATKVSKIPPEKPLRSKTRGKVSTSTVVTTHTVYSRKKSQKKTGDMTPKKVIIDADPGTDDAGAILMLLKNPNIEVIAITVTQGNTSLLNASRNAMRILNMAGRDDIPVYAGSSYSILNIRVEADFYFGQDGMGDVVTEYDNHLGLLQSEKAVSALIRLAEEHKGKLSLLCIGPVTNIALAQQVDHTFGSKIKECVIMGGNYTGRGNITPAAEFNFFRDPEAAQIVLTQMTCPITLVTWELCLSLQLTMEWYDKVFSMNTKNAKFMKAVRTKTMEAAKASGTKYFIVADELAAACLIDDQLALEQEHIACEVELAGHLTRGQVVVDWKNTEDEKVEKHIKLIKKVNVEKFKAMMEDMLSG